VDHHFELQHARPSTHTTSFGNPTCSCAHDHGNAYQTSMADSAGCSLTLPARAMKTSVEGLIHLSERKNEYG
jgi:hypothetical protein